MAEMTPGDQAHAEWACVKLVYRFAELVDGQRFEELADLFDDTAEFNRPSEPNRILKGRAPIVEDFKSRPNSWSAHRHSNASAHLFCNVQATLTSTTTAVGSSYLIVYLGDPDTVTPLGVPQAKAQARIGAFHEEFVYRDGLWKFSRRVGRMIMVAEPNRR